MAEWKANYTTEEDAIVLSYCKEAEVEGVPWATAYVRIAEVLQRPVGSVSNRHGRLRKLMEQGELQTGLSEGELLAVKLKSLVHERKRSVEKTEMWKEKYEELEGEFKKLERRYKSLQNEHQKLIKTVKEALGEEVVSQQLKDNEAS